MTVVIDDCGEAVTGGVPPVFVLDDDPVARAVVCHRLKEVGLANPVWSAADIGEATTWLEASAADPPALVLLDVHLPSGTGLELLRWMRGRPHLAETPVIVLSASAEMEEITSGHELGVRSYLVKPVGLSALGEVVRSLDEPWALIGRGGDRADQ